MTNIKWKQTPLFFIPLFLSLVVFFAYYFTHHHPALAGGFYLAVGEVIIESAPQIPQTVPHYTYDGVRLGMPPFAAILAAGVATVLGPMVTAFVLPMMYHTLSALAGAYLSWTYLRGTDSKRLLFGSLVGGVLATSPGAFFWHLTSGGTIRGLGYFLFLLTVAFTIHVFRDGRRDRLLVLGVLVGLAVSTHPFYGLYSCLTVLMGWLTLDRTIAGFRQGILVALIAAIPASFWLVPFVLQHGVDMYLSVSGTRGGLIHFTWQPLSRLFNAHHRVPGRPPWIYLAFGGLIYAAIQKRWFLFGLAAISVYIVPRPRFMIVVLVLFAGVFLVSVDSTINWFSGKLSGDVIQKSQQVALWGVVISVLIWSTASGVGYVNEDPPAFVDDSDRDVATWASESTAQNATFIVMDGFREWFPLLSDRTSLVAPRGAEWDPPGVREQELREREAIRECGSAACIRGIAASQPTNTDYLIVPTNQVVYGGFVSTPPDALLDSLNESQNFNTVYQNSGNIVFSVNASATE